MAVQSSASAIIYAGNGSSVTPYVVPFPFLLAADIFVAVKDAGGVETLLQSGVGFDLTPTLDVNENITGGFITTPEEYDDTWTVTIFRQVPLTQLTELPEAGPISSRVIERGYDKLVMGMQQIHRRVLALEGNGDDGSVIVVPEGSTGLDALQDVQAFVDAAARGNALPKRVGQLGVQIDQGTLWRAYGTSAGAWVRHNTEAVEEASAAVAARLPAGCISAFAGSVAPAGWLLCFGQVVSRVTYAELFAATGITYGPGDGSTTFALPDLRGRVAAGRDDMGGSAASRLTNSGTGNPGINGSTLGAAGGVDRHTLAATQLPSHTHAYLESSNSIYSVAPGGLGGFSSGKMSATTGTGTGGGEAHPNAQPTLILNYIIRT